MSEPKKQTEVMDRLVDARGELADEIYNVISRWIKHPDAKLDPEFAIGTVLGVLAQVAGEYSATQRVLYNYPDEWSKAYSVHMAKAFVIAHESKLKILESATQNSESTESLNN